MKSKVIEACVDEFYVKFHAELFPAGVVYHNVSIYWNDKIIMKLHNDQYEALLQTINEANEKMLDWAFVTRGETK